MTEKDLFNSINEINPEFITDAWKNTEFSSAPLVLHEKTARHPKLRIFLTAAACFALLSAVGITAVIMSRQNAGMVTPNNFQNSTDPADEYVTFEGREYKSSELSEETLEWLEMYNSLSESERLALDYVPHELLGEDLTDTVDAATGPLPFKLYGPDYQQITYEDITRIKENVSIENLTDSNWTEIICDGFGYFSEPTGENYNSLDMPNIWDSETGEMNPAAGEYLGIYDGEMPAEYKRCDVGDRFGDLTVKSAVSTFWRTPTNGMTEEQLNKAGFPRSLLFKSCELEFDGTANVNAYVIRDIQENGEISYHCAPLYGETGLPVLYIQANTKSSDGGEFVNSRWYGNYADYEIFEYSMELPGIYLSTADGLDIEQYFSEGGSLAKLSLTLTDIEMYYNIESQYRAHIDATILNAEPLEEVQPSDAFAHGVRPEALATEHIRNEYPDSVIMDNYYGTNETEELRNYIHENAERYGWSDELQDNASVILVTCDRGGDIVQYSVKLFYDNNTKEWYLIPFDDVKAVTEADG